MCFLDEINELPRPRSLVEAASFSSEAAAARTRLRLLSDYQCELHLDRQEKRLELGLDILIVATDSARRNASEDAIWPSVREGLNLCVPVSDRLFNANDQPKPVLKALLADCCRHYGLRHVFGKDDVQEWYGSIKLQFGFTRRGCVAKLPDWLMGYSRPTTVSLLLDDPYLVSRSFRLLWETLLAFRRGNLAEVQVRRIISGCPWTLQEWADDLLVAAKKKPHLSPCTSHGGSSGEGARTFLSEPRLRVGPHLNDAQWEIALEGVVDFGLTNKSYCLTVRCGRASPQETFLRKQEDGTYSHLDSMFEFPADRAADGRISALLSDSQGREVAAQDVTLFDPDEDVIVFNQNGYPEVDFLKKGPVAGRLYTMLLRSDLKLSPAPAESAMLEDTGYQLVRCRIEPGNALRILFADGEELWSSLTRTLVLGNQLPLELDLRLELSLADCPRLFETALTAVTLKLTGASGLEIRAARWRGYRLTVIEGMEPRIGGVPKNEAIIAGSVKVQLLLGFNGKTYRTLLEWKPEVSGILEESRGKTAFGEHLAKRSYRQLERGRYWIFPPVCRQSAAASPSWCLFEGDRFVGAVRSGVPYPFHNLGAYGSSITLRPDRFNTGNAQSKLIGELGDKGLFHIYDLNPFLNRDYTFDCWASPEMSENHRLYYGEMHGSVISEVAADRLVFADGKAMFAPFPAQRCDYLALAYEGVRLAAWWRVPQDGASWSTNLINVRDDVDARRAAFTIRWAKLPILSSDHYFDVKAFFRRFPHIVLREWLGPARQHKDGRRIEGENSDAWHDAVREVIHGYRVDNNEVSDETRRKLMRCLAQTHDALPARQVLETLEAVGNCDPLLMGRLLQFWISSETSTACRNEMRLGLLASLPRPTDLHEEWLRATGNSDEKFLETVLERGISAVTQFDLDEIGRGNLTLHRYENGGRGSPRLLAVRHFDSVA